MKFADIKNVEILDYKDITHTLLLTKIRYYFDN